MFGTISISMESCAMFLLKICIIISIVWVNTADANAPYFLVPNSDMGDVPVNEDATLDTSVLKLEAEDPDGDPLEYYVVEQDPMSPMFELDTYTGLLTAPEDLDAETNQLFMFTFAVSDGFNTVDSEPISVFVNDVNEFAPQFELDYYEASVDALDGNGDFVTAVFATDEDVESRIFYSITSGNVPETFSIDKYTGEIYISDSYNLNYDQKPMYNLNVQASDGQKSSHTTVVVTVFENNCERSPCQNGGMCNPSYKGSSFECHCDEGFTGFYCQHIVDNCSPYACPPGSICNNGVNSYTCTCPYGYMGNDCDSWLSADASLLDMDEGGSYWWISLIVVALLGIGIAVPLVLHIRGIINVRNYRVVRWVLPERFLEPKKEEGDVYNGKDPLRDIVVKDKGMAVSRL